MRQKWLVFGANSVVGTAIIAQSIDAQVYAIASASDEPPDLPEDVIYQKTDVLNSHAVSQLCQGADVVICALGLTKHNASVWSEQWPKIVQNLSNACAQHNALFALVDNFYSIDPCASACSHRIDMAALQSQFDSELDSGFGAGAVRDILVSSGVRFVYVGAADYFGPGARNTLLGDNGAGRIINNEAPIILGNADRRHDFAYVPDVAAALLEIITHAQSGQNDDVIGKFWIVPHAIKGHSIREVARDMAVIADRENLSRKIITLPPPAVQFLANFLPNMAEMRDLLPWWTRHYHVDDIDFRQRFNAKPTPYNTALPETILWFQKNNSKP